MYFYENEAERFERNRGGEGNVNTEAETGMM